MRQSHFGPLSRLVATLGWAAAFLACGEHSPSPSLLGSTSSAVDAADCTSFVLTNDGALTNTVSAFCVNGATGALVAVAGSPFVTGGAGGDALYAANSIAVTASGEFLYVSNDVDSTISGFRINQATGALISLGLPVPSGGQDYGGLTAGLSMAVTLDGRFLIAVHMVSHDISVFGIDPIAGALTPIGASVPIGFAPDGIKISPDGKWLAVALPDDGAIAMFAIGPDGSLSSVAGSPFATPFNTQVQAVTINGDSTNLYASGPQEWLYRIGSDGVLTLAQAVYPGGQSPVLSPDDSKLFVAYNSTDLTLNGVWAWALAWDGTMSPINGSPFSDPAGPVQVGTTRSGQFLYAANPATATLSGFRVETDGSLTAVAGSPFATNQVGFMNSFVVAPPPVPHLLTVQIRIKLDAPPPSPISLNARGSLPVAVLSTRTFEAPADVNVPTVKFAGATPVTSKSGGFKEDVVDLNADGLPDLVLYFAYSDLDLTVGSAFATLNGTTIDGQNFTGTEAVKVVP